MSTAESTDYDTSKDLLKCGGSEHVHNRYQELVSLLVTDEPDVEGRRLIAEKIYGPSHVDPVEGEAQALAFCTLQFKLAGAKLTSTGCIDDGDSLHNLWKAVLCHISEYYKSESGYNIVERVKYNVLRLSIDSCYPNHRTDSRRKLPDHSEVLACKFLGKLDGLVSGCLSSRFLNHLLNLTTIKQACQDESSSYEPKVSRRSATITPCPANTAEIASMAHDMIRGWQEKMTSIEENNSHWRFESENLNGKLHRHRADARKAMQHTERQVGELNELLNANTTRDKEAIEILQTENEKVQNEFAEVRNELLKLQREVANLQNRPGLSNEQLDEVYAKVGGNLIAAFSSAHRPPVVRASPYQKDDSLTPVRGVFNDDPIGDIGGAESAANNPTRKRSQQEDSATRPRKRLIVSLSARNRTSSASMEDKI